MILVDYNAVAIAPIVIENLETDDDLIRHMILNRLRLGNAKFRDKYGKMVLCGDGQKNWRREVFPEYKAARRKSKQTSKIDWDNVFRITNQVYEEIEENIPWKVVKHMQAEADDVIAALCYNTSEPTMIISSDKDFVQLQTLNHVKQWSPRTKQLYTTDNPERHRLELILKGDKEDGVPNVLSDDLVFVDRRRQKPLRSQMLEQLINDPHALGDEVYRNYQRNKKMIDLRETPDLIKQEIINTYDQASVKHNTLNYLMKKRCSLLIDQLGDFING